MPEGLSDPRKTHSGTLMDFAATTINGLSATMLDLHVLAFRRYDYPSAVY